VQLRRDAFICEHGFILHGLTVAGLEAGNTWIGTGFNTCYPDTYQGTQVPGWSVIPVDVSGQISEKNLRINDRSDANYMGNNF